MIARNSVHGYRGQGVDVRRVGAELGVQYVVQGSFLRQGGPVRVHVQLIEAATGHHVAATRLDLDFGDLFALFDRITAGVVGALQPELLAAEVERADRTAPKDQTAWQLFIRAQNLLAGPGADANAETRRLLGEAIAREPGAARAHSALALTHVWDLVFLWSADPAASLEAGYGAAAAALALGPVDGWAAIAMGACRLMMRDHDGALQDLRLAVAREPNSALAHGTLALMLAFAGEFDAALEAAAAAHALSPADRRAVIWLGDLAQRRGPGRVLPREAGAGPAGRPAHRRVAAGLPDRIPDPRGERGRSGRRRHGRRGDRAPAGSAARALRPRRARDGAVPQPDRRRGLADALVRAGLPE